MDYTKFYYIFPPRPENTIPSEAIEVFDDGTFIAQPKLNGSCCLIFTNGKEFFCMNRHQERLTNVQIMDELLSLHRGDGWMVLVGEYLNKSKLDENNNLFNHKFVLFDILVYNNKYLLGTTFLERQHLLDEIYKLEEYNSYLFKISDNTYRVKNFMSNFTKLWNEIVKIDVFEGFVFKRKKAPLEIGTSQKNNTKSQLKCRKKTKNYKF